MSRIYLILLFCCSLFYTVRLCGQEAPKVPGKADSGQIRTLPAKAGSDTGTGAGSSQTGDSLALPASMPADTVSVSRRIRGSEVFPVQAFSQGQTAQGDSGRATRTNAPYGEYVLGYMQRHPYFKATVKPLMLPSLERNRPAKDWIFYTFIGILVYLAILRLAFPKYFSDLFRVFFNSSLRQKQIRDQLIQEPLPSLLMNLFFFLSAAIFLYFAGETKGIWKGYPAWKALGFCLLLPVSVYLVKYLVLTAFGWLFGRKEGVDNYLFVVFMVNKILAIFLLPLSIMLAYASPQQASVLGLVAMAGLVVMAIYRLVRSYTAIHKSFRINQLQFIIYVAAFEVIPILLLYKALNTFF